MRPAQALALHQRFTPAPLALAAAMAMAMALAVGHAPLAHGQSGAIPAASTPVAINIPAQPLGQALNELARQANLQMTFPAALVVGKQSPDLSGQLTARQALTRMLAGSGLVAVMEGGAVMIRPAPALSSEDIVLPEVRVTATGMVSASPLGYLSQKSTTGALGEKSLLDTPFSVATVSSEEMAERGAKSLAQIFVKDAAVYTPTSSFSTDWWGTQIRGLPVRNSYVDEIPMMLYWGGDFPTEIVESVTALKGLTGFMYGFGEPGGALSYQLKRPKATNETLLQMDYRNPKLLSVHVDTSRNLSDDLALRGNVATENGTAYNSARIDRTVASLALEKRWGASVKWLSTLAHENNLNRGEPFHFYLSGYDVQGNRGQLPVATYNYDDVNVENAYYQTKTLLASTGVEWQINDQWRMKSQLGFSRKDHLSNKAFAGLLNGAGNYTGYAYNFAGQLDTVFSQAMLHGQVALAGMKHELAGGLGLQVSKDKWASEFYYENDFDGNIYSNQTFLTTRTPDFSLTPVSLDTRQSYAFASDTVHFNEHWQAIAGLRFTNYRIKDLDGDPAVDSGYRTRKVSPTLALIYKPDTQTSVYGSYVEGLEPGSRVSPPYANAGELMGSTVSKQYEVGAKRESGDVDYAAALFRVERANTMEELRGSDRYLTQDGLVVFQGLELSSAYQVNKALNVGLSTVYLNATIDKVSVDNAALKGNAPSFAPKWQVAGNVQYQVPEIQGLKLHGTVRYTGASYTSDQNDLSVPGRTIVNAGFSYDFGVRGKSMTLVGNVYNLFNKKYWAGGGWSAGNLGEARNVSLSVQARF